MFIFYKHYSIMFSESKQLKSFFLTAKQVVQYF
nr:MAG TPA: hypothetical protein [Caudoviricetes sp.]